MAGEARGRCAVARYVLDLGEIDQTQVALVGGKGAHLGELSRIDGVRVPPGFCVTTDAFQRIMAEAPSIDDQLDRLSRLEPDDREAIRALSAEIRQALRAVAIPEDLAAALARPLARLGEHAAYAVRSSATAEDLPTASFAGQHDTYLNVVGPAAILEHVRRCWASLFTARAGTYRQRNGIDPVRSTWPWSCSRWSTRRRPASCSCRRWRPRGGSTSGWRGGWARRTRRTRSPSPCPTTSRPRWGWRCPTSLT
jgi:hypothetical protein